MKKTIVLLVAIAAIAGLNGCGDDNSVVNNVTQTENQETNTSVKNGFEYVSQGRLSETFYKNQNNDEIIECTLFFRTNDKVDSTSLLMYKMVNDTPTSPNQVVIGKAGSLSTARSTFLIFENDENKYVACGVGYFTEDGTEVQLRSIGKKIKKQQEEIDTQEVNETNTSN